MATGEHIPSENTALSPSFGHLPLDVLLPIVKMLTWEPLPGLDEPCADVLFNLIAVNSHLRRLLLTTLSLWTRISSNWPKELQLIFLARSGSTRLHLYFGVFDHAFGLDANTADVDIYHHKLADMRHLLMWTRHATSITFCAHVAAQCQLFFDALNKGAPMLHTLYVQTVWGIDALSVWNVVLLQPQACPRLSYIFSHTPIWKASQLYPPCIVWSLAALAPGIWSPSTTHWHARPGWRALSLRATMMHLTKGLPLRI
jgi:hypothetical protein